MENDETIKYMFLKYGFKYIDRDRIKHLILYNKSFFTEEIRNKFREELKEEEEIKRYNNERDDKMIFKTF